MDKAERIGTNGSIYGHDVDKTRVLREAEQLFMASSVKTRKLVDVLTNCVYIILQGEHLTNAEATDLFFHITRLFQYKSKNTTLRRLTYIGIKALSQQAEYVHVVTSSLTTDVNSSRDDPAVRASALRALCQISDASTYTSIESYLRQSIVDQHPVMASAALTSLIRIAQVNGEIVKRCTSEIERALYSDSPMVQYHALALRYISCRSDTKAIGEFLTACINKQLKSPMAICLLLKILANFLNDSKVGPDATEVYIAYIRDCLEHQSEMVEHEAAVAIVSLKDDNSRQHKLRIISAMSHLRNFLSSPKSSLRFAALRLLNERAATSTADVRFWSAHRIGVMCKLHLLNKRYKLGDEIVGILDFTGSNVVCAKYTCMLQCEEFDYFESKGEFLIGFRQNDFVIAIPQQLGDQNEHLPGSIVHAILSFVFYITDKNYPKALFEDKAGTIELGPTELETKLFSCDFPIAIYT